MAQKHPGRRPAAGSWQSRAKEILALCAPRATSPKRILLGLALVIGYTVMLEVDIFQAGITWRVGEIADHDIYADRTHEFIDTDSTEKLRQAASDAVSKQYDPLPSRGDSDTRIKQLFEDLGAVAADDSLTTQAARVGELQRRDAWVGLDDATAAWALALPATRRDALRSIALDLLARSYGDREIRDDVPEDLEGARAFLAEQLPRYVPDDRRFLTAVLRSPDILKPNRRYNRDLTEHRRTRAGEEVEPVKRTITRGQLIIQRGHRVTEENLTDLRALGLVQSRRDWRALFSLACLVTLVLVILGTYVRLELPLVFYDNHRVLLLNLLALLMLLVFRSLLWLKGVVPALAHHAILCGATTGMVVSVLLDYRLAMMMTGSMALFMGLLLPGAAVWVAFEAWLAGRVGAMALRHVKDRNDLARAGLLVAVAGMMISAVVQLPRSGDITTIESQHLMTDLLFGFGWGLLAFLLAQGLIPLLERPFGCVTPFRLLDLTNLSSPLLHLLKNKARGSFDASLTIGDMAADACEAIGADALLARACGYYHDVGKLVHPTWYVENLFGAENVHGRLEPSMSALAIKSHVTEGQQLARQFHLPKPLADVIVQHHGTTLISFFYYQALERAGDGEQVPEDMFRYEGPRPQFKESGIIMLADGIEAAVRAASGHGSISEKKIQDIVASLIKKRIDDGQLDECDLTLRELSIASQAFCDFLRGMYHGRIEYPTQMLKTRRDGGNGSGHGPRS